MLNNYTVYVDSPISRADDWEDYCNEVDGPLPAAIRARGCDDLEETWLVRARTPKEAIAIATRTATRLRVNVKTDVSECEPCGR